MPAIRSVRLCMPASDWMGISPGCVFLFFLFILLETAFIRHDGLAQHQGPSGLFGMEAVNGVSSYWKCHRAALDERLLFLLGGIAWH